MATINYSFPLQTGYTGNYTVKAYTVASPGVEVTSAIEAPPHSNPVVGMLTVPTYEEHIIKVFGCDNKQIAEFKVQPPSPTCPAPGNPVMSSITGTTATATWAAAPIPPAAGYDWEVFEVTGVTEVSVQTGNTSSLTTNLVGLTAGTKYRFAVNGNCDGSTSIIASVFFETTGTSDEGTVTLEVTGGGGGTVTIQSTTNSNKYTVYAEDETASIKVPYDEYEIIEANKTCAADETLTADPILTSAFILDSGTPTKTITIACEL